MAEPPTRELELDDGDVGDGCSDGSGGGGESVEVGSGVLALDDTPSSVDEFIARTAATDFEQQMLSMTIDELREDHLLMWQQLNALKKERDLLLAEQTASFNTAQASEQLIIYGKMKVCARATRHSRHGTQTCLET